MNKILAALLFFGLVFGIIGLSVLASTLRFNKFHPTFVHLK